jgi:hypothetical protein
VVPGARGAAAAASAVKRGSQKAPCALDLTRSYAEAGLAGEGRSPNATPSAASERGSDASGKAQPDEAPGSIQQAVTPRPVPAVRPRRLPWADLLQRVFGVEALRCKCGHSMRVLAAITDPKVAKRILECMGLPPRAPPLTPARASASVAEPWLEEPAADFDQTPAHDWDSGA